MSGRCDLLEQTHWDNNKNCTSGKGQVNKNGNLVMSFSSKVTTETERQFPHSQFNFATRFNNNRVKGNDSRRRTTTQQDYIYFVRFPSVAGLQKIVLIQQSRPYLGKGIKSENPWRYRFQFTVGEEMKTYGFYYLDETP
jgi:hypothetical protein